MKKLLNIFIFILLSICIYFIIIKPIYITYSNNKSNTKNIIDTKISDLQKQIDTYTQKEQEEKLRKIQLEALQNPEIVTKELSKTGKLLISYGIKNYSDVIKESSFWGSREITLNLNYNFGISIDLNAIKVVKFVDKIVVLEIPKSELKLEYIELDNNTSKISSDKSWFVAQYKPEDDKIIQDNAKAKITEQIKNDKTIFDKANESLKENLTNLIKKLNYEDVIFNEV